MSKLVNSAAGNTIFRTNGIAISDSTQPKLNGGAAANVGSNTGNLSSANLVNGYSLPTQFLEIEKTVWPAGGTVNYSKDTGNILVVDEFDEIEGHGLTDDDVGKQVVINFGSYSGFYNRVGTIVGIVNDYILHIKVTGSYDWAMFGLGLAFSSTEYIKVLKTITNNPVTASDNLILTATANKANNARESIKSLKTTSAIRNNRLNHSNNTFDSGYPEASNDTVAVSLGEDNAQEDTRVTYKMGIGAPVNTDLA